MGDIIKITGVDKEVLVEVKVGLKWVDKNPNVRRPRVASRDHE